MKQALIRFARRKTSWENPELPLEELQKREFRSRDGEPDLQPSTYSVDRPQDELVQCYAEHSHRIDPPRSALALDASEACPSDPKQTPGDTPFEFTRNRHREIPLRDLAELLSFIERLREAKRMNVERAQVEGYVQSRLAANDAEWLTVIEAPDAKSWLQKLRSR